MSTEENLNQDTQNNPGKESAKIKQSYDKAMGSLIAIFKGESNIALVKKILKILFKTFVKPIKIKLFFFRFLTNLLNSEKK